MSAITLVHNAVTAKLVDAPREALLIAQTALSYQVDGAEYTAAFAKGWKGRSSFFVFNSASFPAGFVHHVHRALTQKGYKINLARRAFPVPLGPENPKVDDFGEDPRYDYQMQTVESLLRHGQIIAQIATGGGKSRIARMAYSRIGRNTLFLTTRSTLMYQMALSFKPIAKKVGILGDGHFAPLNGFNVGMVQTLAARLKEPDPRAAPKKRAAQLERRRATIELLLGFEFVILEEAHETSSESFYEIMQYCRNAHYRLALTATPFMKTSECANMRLMACSGPVAIRVTEKTLIDRGILAKPYFQIARLPGAPKKLYRSTPWPRAYDVGIVENEIRNRAIAFYAAQFRGFGLSTMVLVLHKAHGETLKDMLAGMGMRVKFIFGEHEDSERRLALGQLGRGELDVLIGSTILDVGVDVPAVGAIILAGGGKAEVALRQRIGRGLREKKNGPNICFVVDFDDVGNNYLTDHARSRQEIIRSTEGFGENIVPAFDFEGLGLHKVA